MIKRQLICRLGRFRRKKLFNIIGSVRLHRQPKLKVNKLLSPFPKGTYKQFFFLEKPIEYFVPNDKGTRSCRVEPWGLKGVSFAFKT